MIVAREGKGKGKRKKKRKGGEREKKILSFDVFGYKKEMIEKSVKILSFICLVRR